MAAALRRSGGGRFPQPAPSPLPYAPSQVGDMLGTRAGIRREVLGLCYVHPNLSAHLGYQPVRGDLEDLESRQLGELVLWLADGTRGQITRTEHRVRELVTRGMAEEVTA